MSNPGALSLTVEDNALIELWLERPAEQRTLEHVPAYASWVLDHRPELLPKWRDDACECLVRLLADLIHDSYAAAGLRDSGDQEQ